MDRFKLVFVVAVSVASVGGLLTQLKSGHHLNANLATRPSPKLSTVSPSDQAATPPPSAPDQSSGAVTCTNAGSTITSKSSNISTVNGQTTTSVSPVTINLDIDGTCSSQASVTLSRGANVELNLHNRGPATSVLPDDGGFPVYRIESGQNHLYRFTADHDFLLLPDLGGYRISVKVE